MQLEVIELGDEASRAEVLVHDETNPVLAYMLAKMPFGKFPVALGVLYAEQRPTYNATLRHQQRQAVAEKGRGDLTQLLNSGSTWQV